MCKKNGEYKKCVVCFTEYYVRNDRAKNSKYCSHKCWAERGENKIESVCVSCGSNITAYRERKYCSKLCAAKDMVGEKAPKWIDGKSLQRDRARLSTELSEWRNAVYKRDNYTCQTCGDNTTIHAHHIVEWAKDESKRFDLNNGITLCIICHGKIHSKDFTKRHNKYCIDCNKKVKNANTRCRPCSTKNQWKVIRMKKLDSELIIERI